VEFLKWKQLSAKVLTRTFAVACAVSLSACGNSDISRLKAQTLDANPSFTIGQAFDHRKACDSVSWKESTDDRGRKVIEYRCDFNVDKAYYDKALQAQIDQLNRGMHSEQKGLQLQLDQMGHSLQVQEQVTEQLKANHPAPEIQRNIDDQQPAYDAAVAKYQQMKANESQSMADIQKKYEDLIAKAKSEGTVAGATETFQWTVNDDGFTPIYAGRDIQMSTGNVVHQNYADANAERAIAAMIRNDATDLHTYMSEVTWPY